MSNTKSNSAKIAFALPHRPSPKVAPLIFGESLTEQSHKEACDINNIITSATANPMLLADPAPDRKVFRDFSSGDNYLELQNKLCEAQSTFNDLPSDVREYFKNSPSNLVDFVSDENNALRAHEMGLITLDETSLDALKIVNDVSDDEETKTPSESKPKASEA